MDKADTIICLCIILISIAPIILLGIVQYRSKKPVGFWSGKEPPKAEQITDVIAYNHEHGIMWICYGIGMALCFAPMLIFGEDQAYLSVGLEIAECTLGLLLMIVFHNRIEKKYFID